MTAVLPAPPQIQNMQIQKLVCTFACLAAASTAFAAADPQIAKISKAVESAAGKAPDSVKKSPVKGLWEVVIDKRIFYADADASHLIIGRIFEAATERDLTSERLEELNRIKWDQMPLKDAIKVVYGKGERKLIVFTDANCPYCRLLEQNLRKVGNLTVYNFMYPVLRSREEARRIVCAADPTKTFLDSMATGQVPEVGQCSNSAVLDRNLELGQKLGINSIPAVIFPNGSRYTGLMSVEAIEENLAKK